MSEKVYIYHSDLSSFKLKALNWFWLGFFMYSFFFTVSSRPGVNNQLTQLFQLLGIGVMVVSAISFINFKVNNKYLLVLIRLYFFWLITIILRGYTTDYGFIKRILFDAWFGVFLYASPLFLFFPKNLAAYKRFFDVAFIFGFISIGLWFINRDFVLTESIKESDGKGIVETIARNFSIPIEVLLITYFYHPKWKKIVAWGVFFITLFVAVTAGRRGLIIMTVAPAVVAYIVYLYKARVKLFVIVGSVAVGIFLMDYGLRIYTENDTFRYLRQRGMVDTRGGVEEMFFQDMKTIDWIIGRGMNGEYWCPGIEEGTDTGYRIVIETDFLQIILKGGIISLALLLFISIPPIFLGLFRSKNYLTKGAAAWIFLELLNMYPATTNTFSLHYAFFWIAIGMCYSPQIRNLPEAYIKAYFKKKDNKSFLSHFI